MGFKNIVLGKKNIVNGSGNIVEGLDEEKFNAELYQDIPGEGSYNEEFYSCMKKQN